MIQKGQTIYPAHSGHRRGHHASIFPTTIPFFTTRFRITTGRFSTWACTRPGTTRIDPVSSGRDRPRFLQHPSDDERRDCGAQVAVLSPSSNKTGAFTIANVPPATYRLHVFHERATQQTLDALTRTVDVPTARSMLPPITVSESGYLLLPHKNKYGKDYPAESGPYSGSQAVSFSRLSLLWKILLPDLRGPDCGVRRRRLDRPEQRHQDHHGERRARSPRQFPGLRIALESPRRPARHRQPHSQHHVRCRAASSAPGTKPPFATRRANCGRKVSTEDAFFLVADPQGKVIASLGASVPFGRNEDFPEVQMAARAVSGTGFRVRPARPASCSRWWSRRFTCRAGSGAGLLDVLVAGLRRRQPRGAPAEGRNRRQRFRVRHRQAGWSPPRFRAETTAA